MASDIHIRAISQETPQPSIIKISLKFSFLKLLSGLPGANELTHWGWVTHIRVGKPTIIGSDNGLSLERRQAIIWTNAGILLIGPLGTNFSEILIKIQTFASKKIRLKMSSAKCCWFHFGLNVLSNSMCQPHHMVSGVNIQYCNVTVISLWGYHDEI